MKSTLETYLRAALQQKENLKVEELQRINQGNSNRMVGFTLSWRENGSTRTRKYILRMPPEKSIMEPYQPASEYHLLKALKRTAVPVPGVLLLEEDESVLGKPFLIMEKMGGDTLSIAYHAMLPEKKKKLSWEYARTLAEIHSTDWRKLGLPAEDAPGDTSRFAAAELWKCRARLQAVKGIPRQILENVLNKLEENIPQSGELTLIHGDYNVGNVLFSGDEIVAVLDWEIAGIGVPALDLGWLYPGKAMALGLPMDSDDFFALYRKAGGKETGNLRFYHSLAMLKLAMTSIQACLSIEENSRGGLNLPQMGFTIPYILNSLCYLVTSGFKALNPHKNPS